MSGWRTCGSSTGSASNTISERDSVSSTISWAISSSVISFGLPMFTGSCTPDSASATRPRIRSSTKQKLRVCEPSPNTVSGLSVSAWRRKVGTARPSLRPHPRAVGVEDPDDAGVHALLAQVGHRQRLGVALGLVVDAARADRVDVAPVGLGLGVDQRVAVDLGGRGEQEARAVLLREAERVVRAVGADLERVQRQARVVDRAGGRGHVVDEVDRLVDLVVARDVEHLEAEVAARGRARCS